MTKRLNTVVISSETELISSIFFSALYSQDLYLQLSYIYRVTRKNAYRGKIEIKYTVIKIETSYVVDKLQNFISNILVYDT